MKKWKRVFRRFVRVVFSSRTVPSPQTRARPSGPSVRSRYTGRDSLTRQRILGILSDGQWRTRQMIQAELDVKTAAIHLPLMEKDGLIVSEYRSRRKSYRLVPQMPVINVDFTGSLSAMNRPTDVAEPDEEVE